MRILHVAGTRNSENSAAWRILRAQRQAGLDSIALVHETKFNAPDTMQIPKEFLRFNYKTAQISNSVLSKWSQIKKPKLPWSYNLFTGPEWSTEINKEFDIINIHWLPSVVDYDFLSKIHKPIVLTLHDVWPLTGGCHCNLECERWLSGCNECPQIHKITPWRLSSSHNWKRKFDAFNKIRNLGIAAPSKWISSIASQSPLFKNRRIEVVRNCVDEQIFANRYSFKFKREIGLNPEKMHLLFVVSGDLNQYHKGFDFVIEALGKLATSSLASKLELIVVGNIPEKLNQDIGIPVRYLGQVNSEIDLSKIYSASDIFISGSRQDNLPNTLVESTMCGTPVVAFDVGGISDIVTPGVNGSLVKLGDVEGMSNEILKLIRLPLDRINVANIAREKFAFSVSASQYLHFYTKVIEDSNYE